MKVIEFLNFDFGVMFGKAAAKCKRLITWSVDGEGSHDYTHTHILMKSKNVDFATSMEFPA